jgi:protein ImuA
MLDPGRLTRLRVQMARLETAGAKSAEAIRTLTLGISPLDAALGGGLAFGAVHEIGPAQPMHLGAATGFAVALSRRAGTEPNGPGRSAILWIQQEFSALEAGRPYGEGLAPFGLPMARLVHLAVRHTRDALWAMEEALKSGAIAAVVTELARDDIDLTASRRLSLAAAEGGALGLVLSHQRTERPSAAVTRWEVAAAPGARDAFGGLGATAFSLSLVKNRRGPTGRWLASWDHHACAFLPTLSLGVAETACDRPGRASLVRAS